jgi:tetratricopeptide (TPR) repeat protein
VGKTRLVAALVDRAANGPVVDLHGSPFHGEVGFHPVRTLIEARCKISDDDSPAARLECLTHDVTELGLDPAATVPLLAPVAGVDPRAGYDQAPAVGRLLEEQVTQAVLDYTSACLQDRPGIIVAENLHWFDPATRALLEKLLRVGAGTMLIVATSRNPEPGPWEAIELRPLSLAGQNALLDALEQDLTDEDRLALATRSGGIPLYLEELVRAGDRDQRGVGVAAPVPGSVPEVLYEPLVARLYATPSAIPVAATAAAAGQEVERSLLAATMPDMPATSLDATLDALVEARILETVRGRSERYQFRHELLREVAYELQPPSWRREVHSRLCDVLAEDESRDWQVLASHFERAERHSEAAAAYQETADLARRRGALSEARTHLTRAIDLVLPLDAGAARDHHEVQLRLRRGFLAMSQEGAGSAQASADFDRCRELAASDPGGDDMISTLISLWAYYLSRGELDRAREVTVTLRGTLGEQPETLRPTNPAGAGMLDWFAGDFTSASEQLTAAVDALDKLPGGGGVEAVWFVPNRPFVAMHVHLALARFMVGDTAGADQSLVRARQIASSLDFPQGPWSAAYAIWLGSWTWIEAGRLEPAEQALAELEALSARHGLDSWGLIGATQTAALEAARALRSESSDTASLLDCAGLLGSLLDVWRAVELRVFLPFYLTTTGAVLAAAGDAEAARGRYEESLALSAETGMRFYDAETLRRMGRLESALDLARAQGARVFEQRIELDLRAPAGEEARSLR